MIEPYTHKGKNMARPVQSESTTVNIAAFIMVMMVFLSVLTRMITMAFNTSGATKALQDQNIVVPTVANKEQMVRVFLHQNSYSVLTMDENKRLNHVDFSFCSFEVFCDVPDGEPMWFVKHGSDKDWSRKVELHVHSPQDINGADWKAGKHHGQTKVIE